MRLPIIVVIFAIFRVRRLVVVVRVLFLAHVPLDVLGRLGITLVAAQTLTALIGSTMQCIEAEVYERQSIGKTIQTGAIAIHTE